MNQQQLTIGELVASLEKGEKKPLKFYFENAPIKPGYHVTELRHATINSVDCGKRQDQWDEVTIQILDGLSASDQGYMSTSKFSAIVGAAVDTLAVDAPQLLFFEYAPNNGPIRKLCVESIKHKTDEVSVVLASERAVCKPLADFMAASGPSSPARRNLPTKSDRPANTSGACCG